jgi:DNA repair exonuclease SbcCD ATPase subunit
LEVEMNVRLLAVIVDANLPVEEEGILVAKFEDYDKIAEKWKEECKTIIVTDGSQTALINRAREGRLILRDKRINIEKTRKILKEESLRKGQAIDKVAKYLKELIEPLEDYLDKQENFAIYKAQAEAAEAAEKARVERERLDILEATRKSIAAPYRNYWTTEEYSFRTMSEANFLTIMEDLKSKKKAADAEQTRIREENAALKKKQADDQAEKDRLQKIADDAIKAKEKAETKVVEVRKQVTVIQTRKNEEIKELRFENKELRKLTKCPKCGHNFEAV